MIVIQCKDRHNVLDLPTVCSGHKSLNHLLTRVRQVKNSIQDMKWFFRFLRSSLGRKLVMSLTGLFLISFLVIHLIGNMQLLISEQNFTGFVEFMENSPIIKLMAWVLYAGFLLHIVQGILIWLSNRKSSGASYRGAGAKEVSWASKNMGILGLLILAFLILHLSDYFYELKIAHEITDQELYEEVVQSFKQPVYVGVYVLSMFVLGLHLWHGFQSAFQTLGLSHPKYTPLVKGLGKAYAVIVPALFAFIPIYVYFFM